jgi:hypothetical protein
MESETLTQPSLDFPQNFGSEIGKLLERQG